jgi:hypothetical protein
MGLLQALNHHHGSRGDSLYCPLIWNGTDSDNAWKKRRSKANGYAIARQEPFG